MNLITYMQANVDPKNGPGRISGRSPNWIYIERQDEESVTGL
jgi:hypothetical protein